MTARRKKSTIGKRYPILFSEHMVNSTFDGTRTQIRKNVVFNKGFEKPLPFMWDDKDWWMGDITLQRKPGDAAWWWVSDRTVSKYIAANPQYGGPGSILYAKEQWSDVGPRNNEHIIHRFGPSNGIEDDLKVDWKLSISMKKRDARLWLRIRSIRAETLHAITNEDMKLSGFNNLEEFKQHWRSAYFRSSLWEDNPWVWVIDFTVDNRMTRR